MAGGRFINGVYQPTQVELNAMNRLGVRTPNAAPVVVTSVPKNVVNITPPPSAVATGTPKLPMVRPPAGPVSVQAPPVQVAPPPPPPPPTAPPPQSTGAAGRFGKYVGGSNQNVGKLAKGLGWLGAAFDAKQTHDAVNTAVDSDGSLAQKAGDWAVAGYGAANTAADIASTGAAGPQAAAVGRVWGLSRLGGGLINSGINALGLGVDQNDLAGGKATPEQIALNEKVNQIARNKAVQPAAANPAADAAANAAAAEQASKGAVLRDMDKVQSGPTIVEAGGAGQITNQQISANEAVRMRDVKKAELATAQDMQNQENARQAALIESGAGTFGPLGNRVADKWTEAAAMRNANAANQIAGLEKQVAVTGVDQANATTLANEQARLMGTKYTADQNLAQHKFTAQLGKEAKVEAAQTAASAKMGLSKEKAAEEERQAAEKFVLDNSGERSPENMAAAIRHNKSYDSMKASANKFIATQGVKPGSPQAQSWVKIIEHASSGKPWDASIGMDKQSYDDALLRLSKSGVNIPLKPTFTPSAKNNPALTLGA